MFPRPLVSFHSEWKKKKKILASFVIFVFCFIFFFFPPLDFSISGNFSFYFSECFLHERVIHVQNKEARVVVFPFWRRYANVSAFNWIFPKETLLVYGAAGGEENKNSPIKNTMLFSFHIFIGKGWKVRRRWGWIGGGERFRNACTGGLFQWATAQAIYLCHLWHGEILH